MRIHYYTTSLPCTPAKVQAVMTEQANVPPAVAIECWNRLVAEMQAGQSLREVADKAHARYLELFVRGNTFSSEENKQRTIWWYVMAAVNLRFMIST